MITKLLISLAIPLGLDLFMPIPDTIPVTAEKVEMGRRMFFDRRLSADGTVSCASCHQPDRAFSDPRPVSIGVFGRRGHRNAPTLINRGYGRVFFWDGRTTTLEDQVKRPIENPLEMGASVAGAAARVGQRPVDLVNSLASFVRSILAGNSNFDRFVSGDRTALTDEELRGLGVFRGKGNCTACHSGPTFSDESFHNTGVAFRNGRFIDDGRLGVTGLTQDRGAFKTPTLREVSATAPYMHDGSVSTLAGVVDFYDRGGVPNPALDPGIRPLRLTNAEKRSLSAFLGSLSGGVTYGQIRARSVN